MTEETLASKAIRLLEPIPAGEFMVNEFTNKISKCCAIGHLVRLTEGDPNEYNRNLCDSMFSLAAQVRETSEEFLLKIHNISGTIASVNNYPNINGYKESEIKDRVMHLLKDMKTAGY